MGLFNHKRKKTVQAQLATGASKSAGGSGSRSGAAAANQIIMTPDFGGARTTIPRFMNGGGGVGGALPKFAQQNLSIDDRALAGMSIPKLMDTLSDAHPDLSYAVWNFLRLGNTDYSIEIRKPGSDKPFTQGQKIIDQFFDRLDTPNLQQYESSRSIKKVLNQLFLMVITRGAASLELILDPDKVNVAFLGPVDPSTVDFQYINERFVPFQNNLSLNLDLPTFLYETLDERIDDPYGRNPLLGALNMVMFQTQVLQDIKAVVHNQGYPRFDIKIVEEVLLNRMPISIRNNEVEKQKWLNNKMQEIIKMYNNLSPDDTFVHFDSIEIGTAGGGKGGGALIDPEKLMTAIDNLVMTGLKTLSTILGRRSNGNTESFAKIEIKLYIQGVKALQEVVERLMSRALTILMNLQGKQAIVSFKFKPIEIRTELEQAQFEQIKLMNIAMKRDQGWIDQDTASLEAVGTPSVAEPNFEALGVIKNKNGGTPQGSTDNNPAAAGGGN